MNPKLFFLILGCTPAGRNTEQHDTFFGIGNSLKDLLPQLENFWPGTKLHIDSWREVTAVDGYQIKIIPARDTASVSEKKLFFLNLGGYKPDDMEEYHYKLLCVAKEKGDAVKQAKQNAFYRHTGFKGATSHIDDKYGVDVDDVYEITDILSAHVKSKYSVMITEEAREVKDELHIGYVKLSTLK